MDAEIRPLSADEVETFIRVGTAAFGCNPSAEQVEEQRPEVPELGRTLAAFSGARMVATAADHGLEVTVPGGRQVSMSGLTWVGVLPTHRRRGLLRALVRRHLDAAHERGDPLCGLEASEGGIYGRFGFGPATYCLSWELERDRARLAGAPADAGSVELVSEKEAAEILPAIHDLARRQVTGDVKAAPGWWEGMLRSDARGHDGAGGKLFAVHRAPGGQPDAGAVYRIPEGEGSWAHQAVHVDHLVATRPEGYTALWGVLVDLDLTAKVVAGHRPVDEPLRWMLADPRQLRVTGVRDLLWVRLVDLAAALSARRYATDGSVVLEVTDAACPWNEGRWLLSGGPEGAECRRAGGGTVRPGGGAELALDASGLASAYLGGVSLVTLVAAGRATELVPGTARRFTAMLAVDPAPWCSTGF